MEEKSIIVQEDPWLDPYDQDIKERQARFTSALNAIEAKHNSLEEFATGYTQLGINYDAEKNGFWYREWAPAAQQLSVVGEFNKWDRSAHPMQRATDGVWEIFLSEKEFVPGSKFKVAVQSAEGVQDRIPAYASYVVQNPDNHDFSAIVRSSQADFRWTDSSFNVQNIGAPTIYECHVGMAQQEAKVGSYKEFEENVLPRIAALGYNCIQMMAVQEHPYYGSFGYHVSSFFGVSSRFGTPEDLKSLINKAHELGVAVLLDVVHSHAVKNIAEGLNDFDGSGGQYFHEGDRGTHNLWDSKLFNYGKREVQQFLLSNIRYWLEEFHFDGFRFDGVTSMMYFHHGDIAFDHYDKYFKDGVEWDAITYLQLANELIKRIKPGAISIAEDMSGMPGLCRKIEDGGVGFDFRLGMGIPDFWIKLLKHSQDEEWNIEEIWGVLQNRRSGEKTIAYAESHDQALVGDKTLAFWLMDQEMYWHMRKDADHHIIDRGIALHKLIRMLTIAAGGEGYLNFIGNEFGHPEWVDFPREGNDWSYQYCRRQWNLVDNKELKYEYLNNFDQAMLSLFKGDVLLQSNQLLNVDHLNKTLIFSKDELVFVFNLHINASISDYQFWVPEPGTYQIILNSDAPQFGGFDRVDESVTFTTDADQKLSIYNVNRACLVLKRH